MTIGFARLKYLRDKCCEEIKTSIDYSVTLEMLIHEAYEMGEGAAGALLRARVVELESELEKLKKT